MGTTAITAQAVHDILTLVRDDPDRVLWVPGRAWWGLALLGGSERALLALDGCLTIAAWCWPGHYPPSQEIDLDEVLGRLHDCLPLQASDGQARWRCALPPALCGQCCVLLTTTALPWLPADLRIAPQPLPQVWTAPEDPGATPAPMPVHPWQTLRVLRPAPADLAALVQECDEPWDQQCLPPPVRLASLVRYWRACARHEAARLRLLELPVPGWLADEAALAAAARAWVAAHPWPLPDTGRPP